MVVAALREWLATDSERAAIEDRSHDWMTKPGRNDRGPALLGRAHKPGLFCCSGEYVACRSMTRWEGEEYEIDAILIGPSRYPLCYQPETQWVRVRTTKHRSSWCQARSGESVFLS